ncbi:MAG: methyltransferase domain-containing protein [Gammaproteobacteria bacterium]|nr:methyltransferase domain-containing protein [Gammaproteobacteria bacterium]
MTNNRECPSCGAGGMELFFEQRSVPTNSCILMATPEEAKSYPRGNIDLCFCPQCGFISNMAFDAKLTEYSGRYEETQGFSGTFNKFHKNLADRLIKKYDLHGKDVIEIGCGKGEFITMLSELGDNHGVGFDPGYREDRNISKAAKNVKFITDFYSEKYTDYKADFVCCKMTLEHIHPTHSFMDTVRRSIGERPDTIVFFQIPEATRILKEVALEDIYYEHCSYFTPGSLARLFRRSGFNVLSLETEYGDQYLTIEAMPGADDDQAPLPEENDLKKVREYVATFPQRFAEKQNQWLQRLAEYKSQKKKVVLWGSGSKGVSFLTMFDHDNSVEYAVDINPHRQGYYMSGTGQKIIAPSVLAEYKPDVVLVMNQIYCDEIGRDLQKMGLSPDIVAL